MLDSSVLLTHILSQTHQNIAFLLSQNQISVDDAQLILAKIPTAPVEHAGSGSPAQSGILTPPLSTGCPSASTTPLPPPPPPQQVRAEWSYNQDGKEPNDLSFNTGDVIDIVSFMSSDWWIGRLNGRQGLFPSNHVKLFTGAADAPPASSSPPHSRALDSKIADTPNPPAVQVQNPPQSNSSSASLVPTTPAPPAPQLQQQQWQSQLPVQHLAQQPAPQLAQQQPASRFKFRVSSFAPPPYVPSHSVAYNPNAGPPTHRHDQPVFLRPGYA